MLKQHEQDRGEMRLPSKAMTHLADSLQRLQVQLFLTRVFILKGSLGEIYQKQQNQRTCYLERNNSQCGVVFVCFFGFLLQ